jgi:hypothetical protein
MQFSTSFPRTSDITYMGSPNQGYVRIQQKPNGLAVKHSYYAYGWPRIQIWASGRAIILHSFPQPF